MKSSLLCVKIIVLIRVFVGECLHARESDEDKQVKIGNLAVAGTNQPGPLLSFGQYIITECEALGMAYPSWFSGKNKSFTDLLPYVVYGLREDMSITLAFPTALSFKQNGCHSSGSQDMYVQLEYAFYAKHHNAETNQLTLVTTVFLPSGNECKNPATGFGSPSIFLGVTASHLATEWYCFTSYGALFTTKYNHIKFGNQFFYQAGVGKNIAYRADKWLLMWMVEMYGWYAQKTKVNGVTDNNSGFNMVILGPSLWFSTNRLIIQFGVAPVVYQHLFGEQLKNSFSVLGGIGYRFD